MMQKFHSGLSNKKAYILAAQGATKLRAVKFGCGPKKYVGSKTKFSFFRMLNFDGLQFFRPF